VKNATDPCVLVADDDPEICELVAMYLETEGMKVTAAADGHQVQHLVEEACQQFDLYILDVMMPGPDGYELCRRLRRRTDVPIILLTARDAEQDKVLGLGVGADDYVTKPFSPLELVARVKAHLRRFNRLADSGSGDVLQCGCVTVNTRARRVARNGCEVELTAKEYRILEYLAQNAGQVLTRTQIFEAVWEEPFLGDDNTVMVHIRHLREKLERDPSNPELITTIRGLGYRLESDADD
jgi:DNA-binding response OmpR family regulator